jgi:hypothetical protein
MTKLDEYTVWAGIILVMGVVIGSALNVPILILALIGLVGVVLGALFLGLTT